jgi:hypothetical protein
MVLHCPFCSIMYDEYQATIPGLTHTCEVEYYLRGSDEDGYSATDPPGAPAELHDFVVAPQAEILTDAIESGAPDWTHGPISGGFSDQWHISTARNHTPAGASSWKCGNTGSGDYGNLLFRRLLRRREAVNADAH